MQINEIVIWIIAVLLLIITIVTFLRLKFPFWFKETNDVDLGKKRKDLKLYVSSIILTVLALIIAFPCLGALFYNLINLKLDITSGFFASVSKSLDSTLKIDLQGPKGLFITGSLLILLVAGNIGELFLRTSNLKIFFSTLGIIFIVISAFSILFVHYTATNGYTFINGYYFGMESSFIIYAISLFLVQKQTYRDYRFNNNLDNMIANEELKN